jgi:hypothetical protein
MFTILLVIVSTLLLIVDWGQTQTIFKNPARWHETNSVVNFLYQKFKFNGIHFWFLTCIAINFLIAFLFLESYLIVGIAVSLIELYYVVNNLRLHIKSWN